MIAIEPSDEMAAQRPPHRAPAIRAFADALPLRTDAVDAALAVLTVHHWDEGQREGIREMRRVARGPVVIVTIDAECSGRMWLMADYLHEVADLDRRIFRAGTSGFARMSKAVVDHVVSDVGRDLADGRWDARHGHLRQRPSLDVGLRIVVSPGKTA